MACQSLPTKIDSLIGFIDDNLTTISQTKQKIVICGAGNAAHVFCGLCAADPNNEVHLLSLFRTEAKDFETALKKTAAHQLTVEVVQTGTQIESTPYNITNDAKCLQNADIVIISLPAFAHAQYLNACKQNIQSDNNKKTLIAIFPGASGVECEWQSIMGKQANFVLLSCITLPWAARIKTFGQIVEILSTKNKVEVCLYGARGDEKRYIALMQKIIVDCQLVDYGHILSMSLSAMNAVAHPALLYAKWRNWDGVPLKEKPLFYHGVDKEAGDIMCSLSSQIIEIAKCVEQQTGVTLHVPHIFDWFLQVYGTSVGDTSCLHKAMLTNPGYNGLVHPMTEQDDGTFVPNWNYRYLKEDIPFGLIVIRGLSLILESKYQQELKPKLELMDKIIVWSQRCLQKEYFVYNEQNEIVKMGKDIQETRAPQRYNITNIKDLM
mmetsp:Transcript_38220/g.62666  ORF Transcript_38220/g.62666 Transcript_38220/m.62666 type:complete len:436 (-) Transcript_38220:12-1319(-)